MPSGLNHVCIPIFELIKQAKTCTYTQDRTNINKYIHVDKPSETPLNF